MFTPLKARYFYSEKGFVNMGNCAPNRANWFLLVLFYLLTDLAWGGRIQGMSESHRSHPVSPKRLYSSWLKVLSALTYLSVCPRKPPFVLQILEAFLDFLSLSATSTRMYGFTLFFPLSVLSRQSQLQISNFHSFLQ